MTRTHAILTGPLLLSIFGIAFCVWTALGNEVNFCVTTGCTLYQDFTIWGVSLWWYGTGALTALLVCALFGLSSLGRVLAAIFLFGDLCLLMLMAVTAPCISCLCIGLVFAIEYFLFRRVCLLQRSSVRFSLLLIVWGVFFLIICGQVVRSQFTIWPILDESGQPRSRMFFSPSCPHCVEGIRTLSGNIDMAFYPVADNPMDVYRLVRMQKLLEEGESLIEALEQSRDVVDLGFWGDLDPEVLVMRFHLLCNRAHVLGSDSPGVPFFEYLGLPPYARETKAASDGWTAPDPASFNTGLASTLPPELETSSQCIQGDPCEPGQ